MNAEIIVAVRGELPENLKRTVDAAAMAAPVCVVYDGMERVVPHQAPPRIAATSRVRVCHPWAVPRGCGQARHYGIMSSKADVVVLVDGHMTFPDGWIENILAYLSKPKHAKHLVGCRMQSLRHDWTPSKEEIFNGAFLATMTAEACNEYWALSAKWNRPGNPKGGAVGAVMGACYAMRKSWYKAIGQPLRILSAWGGDEEILSVCTHVMGGRVWLLPIVCGHVYAAPHQGRVRTADEDDRAVSNRYAIVNVLPATDAEKEGLLHWLAKTHRVCRGLETCFPPERVDAIGEVGDLLKTGVMTWADMLRTGLVRKLTDAEQAECLGRNVRRDDEKRATPAAVAKEVNPQIVVRHSELCRMCGAVNSFRKACGNRHIGGMQIAYAKCCRCGHKVQIRLV